jgi:hypothetical protein
MLPHMHQQHLLDIFKSPTSNSPIRTSLRLNEKRGLICSTHPQVLGISRHPYTWRHSEVDTSTLRNLQISSVTNSKLQERMTYLSHRSYLWLIVHTTLERFVEKVTTIRKHMQHFRTEDITELFYDMTNTIDLNFSTNTALDDQLQPIKLLLQVSQWFGSVYSTEHLLQYLCLLVF